MSNPRNSVFHGNFLEQPEILIAKKPKGSNLDPTTRGKIARAERELTQLNRELQWEIAQAAADLAGIVDPTPISDSISLGISVVRGDPLDTALSLISMSPWVGDALAKPLKQARNAERLSELYSRIAKLINQLEALRGTKTDYRRISEVGAKAKAQVFEQLDGSHSLTRHGPEVSNEALRRRLTQGIAPDKPGKVVSPTPGSSTRFGSYLDWTLTREKARDEIIKQAQRQGIDLREPPPSGTGRFTVVVEYNRPVGEGFVSNSSALKIPHPTKQRGHIPVYDRNNIQKVENIVRTRTVIEWDTKAQQWQMKQHFPDTTGLDLSTGKYRNKPNVWVDLPNLQSNLTAPVQSLASYEDALTQGSALNSDFTVTFPSHYNLSRPLLPTDAGFSQFVTAREIAYLSTGLLIRNNGSDVKLGSYTLHYNEASGNLQIFNQQGQTVFTQGQDGQIVDGIGQGATALSQALATQLNPAYQQSTTQNGPVVDQMVLG